MSGAFHEGDSFTARPRGTLQPFVTLTLMGHFFEKGPKILKTLFYNAFSFSGNSIEWNT